VREAFLFGGQGDDPIPAARLLPEALRRGLGALLELDLDRALRVVAPALRRTEARQPLQVATSLAVAERLPRPPVVFGHSLGALTARAYALGLEPLAAATIARHRATAMARVAEACPGDLVACTETLARALLGERPESVALAARNAPGEWVLAVRAPALAHALASGARRLRVGGPWHGPWMAPAARQATAAMAALEAPLPADAPRVIGGDDLLADLSRPLDWERTLREVAGHVGSITVVGPGRAHRALIRRVLPTMNVRLVERLDAPALSVAS
jgi:malonyl CoA-acyl carrier protein transacylase